MKTSMFHFLAALAIVLSPAAYQTKAAEPVSANESEAVELFKAIDEGLVEVKLIPKNSLESSLSVTNKSDKPIVVDMPTAFAGVPAVAQPPGGGMMGGFGGGGFGGGMMGGEMGGMGGMGGRGGMGMGRNGGMGGRNSGGGSGNQSVGGGMGGGNRNGGGMGGSGRGGRGGGGMFSIEPNQTHREKVRTVCLEHGKKEPRSTIKYTIVPIDSYTDNKTTQVLCEMLGDEELDQKAVQAAVWSAENGLTFDEMAAKQVQSSFNTPAHSFFETEELSRGLELLEQANGRAQELEEVEKAQADLEKYAPEKTDDTIETLTERVLSE